MYLIDTNVISERRRETKTNNGVAQFFRDAAADNQLIYISAISTGELRRGVELMRHRGDTIQADRLETWLSTILDQFNEKILPFDARAAQVWGYLSAPDPQHALDKQIAAIALVNDLTVVTRNTGDFVNTGVRLHDPFSSSRTA